MSKFRSLFFTFSFSHSRHSLYFYFGALIWMNEPFSFLLFRTDGLSGCVGLFLLLATAECMFCVRSLPRQKQLVRQNIMNSVILSHTFFVVVRAAPPLYVMLRPPLLECLMIFDVRIFILSFSPLRRRRRRHRRCGQTVKPVKVKIVSANDILTAGIKSPLRCEAWGSSPPGMFY